MTDNAFRLHNKQAARLTPAQVHEIRRLYREGWTQGRLCREFDVGVGQIGRIVRGESWRDLPPPPLSAEEQAAMLERLLQVQKEHDQGMSEKMREAIAAERERAGRGDRMLEELAGASEPSEGVKKKLKELTGKLDAPPVPPSPLDE